jgi:hypothetical protein
MSKRRGRARKRRSGAGQAAVAAPVEGSGRSGKAAARKAEKSPPRRAQSTRPHRDPGGVGPRPEAPWHPWPFSEILIFAGAVATIIGFVRGAAGRAVLFAGIGSVVLGTLEFTVREHLSGYRAHTALIAAVPTALFHGGCALLLYELGAPHTTWVVVPLALDVPLFWFLFRALKARFDDARRERVFALSGR